MSQLYFIALIPDEPVLSEVRELKQYCKDHFDSGHALRSPAHITLYPPFRSDENTLNACMQGLRPICAETEPFDVALLGFGCFRPRVIFIQPEESTSLMHLQQKVADLMIEELNPKKRDQRPFHPHMTVAFRDLTKGRFVEAWDYFKNKEYQRTWTASDLAVLIHGESGWSVLQRISF